MMKKILEKLLNNSENDERVRHDLMYLLDSFMQDTTCDEDDIASIVGNVSGDEIKAFVGSKKGDLPFSTFSRLCSLCGAAIKLDIPRAERVRKDNRNEPKTETHETISVTYTEKFPGKEKESYTIKFDSDDPDKCNCAKNTCCNEKDKYVKECDNSCKGSECQEKDGKQKKPILDILCDEKFAKTFVDLLGLDDDDVDGLDDFINTFKNL